MFSRKFLFLGSISRGGQIPVLPPSADAHAWSIYAYYLKKAEKIGKVIMRKVATSRKSRTHNRQ